jgi:gliding motility-associated-like protein
LEANSLSSKTPITINQTVSPQLFSNPNWIAEGCASATIELSRENNFNIPVTIPIQVSGTATNGTDYSAVPSSITLGSGQSNTSFTIDALFDGIQEGLETLTLTFQVTDPCGNITPIVINLFIQDVAPLDVTLNNPTITCPGDNINLTANVTGGLPTYEYLWNTGETSSSIEVVPTATGIYSIQVTDACLDTTVYDSVLVTVPVYVPLSVIASDDIVEICPYVPQTINAIASGGSGIYSYQWFRANQLIGQSASIQVNPSTSTSYVVQVIDNCGAISYDTVTYTILSPPLIVNTSPNIELCPGDSAFISATASGGYGNYHFVWTHNGDTSQGIWVKPNSTFSYNVVVSDDCQTFTVSAFVVVTIVKPEANFIPISENLIEGLPISFYNLTTNGYTYQWYFGDGDQSTLINPNNIYDTAGTYYITLVAWDAKGCVDTITKPITILEEFYIYIPNAFIPDQDRINNFFSGSFIGVKWIKMEIFNRWGELIYFSEDQNFKWDGTYQGKRVPDGVYTWKLTYKPNRSMEELMTGHVNVLR